MVGLTLFHVRGRGEDSSGQFFFLWGHTSEVERKFLFHLVCGHPELLEECLFFLLLVKLNLDYYPFIPHFI